MLATAKPLAVATTALASAFFACCPLRARPLEDEPDALLQTYAHFTDRDLRHLRNGQIVVKLFPTEDDDDVAVAGVVRIHVPAEFFVRKYRDVESFKKAPEVLKIRKLSKPPRLEDFDALELPKSELDDLSDCRPGDCQLKLSVEMMDRLSNQNSQTSSGGESANRVFRQLLLDYVTSYLMHGNSALIKYADKRAPESSANDFAHVLDASLVLQRYAPDFARNLSNFPGGDEPQIDDYVYWSQERFGLKPVVSVTHVLVFPTTPADAQWHFLASKQIYADHYFDASLGLTILLDIPDQQSCWLIYMNRSRSDSLTGWFSAIKRAIVRSRVRAGMVKNIGIIKNRLEVAYPASGH